MRVLVTGAGGQLGYELKRTVPATHALTALGSADLDVTDAAAIARVLADTRPAVVINAAGYTAVDKAESESKRAEAVNGVAPALLAAAASKIGARLIQVSTDFVFDGAKGSPYLPQDTPSPQSVYGKSKLAGERGVLGAQPDALVVRTAWMYSAHGSNFVKTMLRLMQERDALSVVADQVGTPTWARGLAEALWRSVDVADLRGVHHWTDAGVASWYDFAVAIQEEGLARGLLERPITIRPIRTEDYPTPARRPAYSVLDKTATWKALACTAPHWRVALRGMLRELKESP